MGLTPEQRLLLQAHGRGDHVNMPNLTCPACRKFRFKGGTRAVSRAEMERR